MRVLTTSSGSFSERLSIVCWHPELIGNVLTTFVYFGSNQASTSSGMLMCFIMKIFIFVLNKRLIVVSVLLLQSWVNLNRILVTRLRHLLTLTNLISALTISLIIYSTMWFHPLILHLVVNRVWSSIWLRRSSLDITTLHSTLTTYCYLFVSFQLSRGWDYCLRCVHCLNISKFVLWSHSVALLVRSTLTTTQPFCLATWF